MIYPPPQVQLKTVHKSFPPTIPCPRITHSKPSRPIQMDVHSMMHEALPYHTYHTVVSSGISQPKVDRRTRKSPRAAAAARLSLRSGTESVVAALWLWDTVRFAHSKAQVVSQIVHGTSSIGHASRRPTHMMSRCQRLSLLLDSETRPGAAAAVTLS